MTFFVFVTLLATLVVGDLDCTIPLSSTAVFLPFGQSLAVATDLPIVINGPLIERERAADDLTSRVLVNVKTTCEGDSATARYLSSLELKQRTSGSDSNSMIKLETSASVSDDVDPLTPVVEFQTLLAPAAGARVAALTVTRDVNNKPTIVDESALVANSATLATCLVSGTTRSTDGQSCDGARSKLAASLVALAIASLAAPLASPRGALLLLVVMLLSIAHGQTSSSSSSSTSATTAPTSAVVGAMGNATVEMARAEAGKCTSFLELVVYFQSERDHSDTAYQCPASVDIFAPADATLFYRTKGAPSVCAAPC